MTEKAATIRELFPTVPAIEGERVVLRRLTEEDADGLLELAQSEQVNRYLPTFLLEKQTDDERSLIRRLYNELMEDNLFLGVFNDDDFYGLMELYGYKDYLHKISIGCRLNERSWGKGVATEATKLLVDYLYTKTNIEIITASSMTDNPAAANALRKCGFTLVERAAPEDWGYDTPTLADKWIR